MTDDTSVEITFRMANKSDARAVRAVRLAAAEDLVQRFGPGHWSTVSALPTVKRQADAGLVLIAESNAIVGTGTISSQKIPFYRKEWFRWPEDAAMYLTNMAVHPDHQRNGTGSQIMREIERRAVAEGLLAVRFDAYDAAAGAGRFYEKCGYRCVHRGDVNGVALEYFEKVLR